MIPVQNIYYMIAYAFNLGLLHEHSYRRLAAEYFSNAKELYAAILARGINNQIKRGLYKDYIPRSEQLSKIIGKVDISESIKSCSIQRRRIYCLYDEFSVNSYLNRIIKSTVDLLIKSDISAAIRKELKKVRTFFDGVDLVNLASVDWNFKYSKNNQTYRLLITICYLIAKELLQSRADGAMKFMDFEDQQKEYHLYERFILGYYKKEYSHISEMSVSAPYVEWQVDYGRDNSLPNMKTDIMLKYRNKVLIIDAKYYERTMQKRYGSYKISSAHLYQIFTYVKNKEFELRTRELKYEVSGMLLYAKTNEENNPESVYGMSGNKIEIRTLDLNRDFAAIRQQLDDIAEQYFGIKA